MDLADRVHFDHWAKRYDRSPLQLLLFGPTHAAVLDAAAHWTGTPGTLLDIGCGTGRLLERAAERWPGTKLLGIDNAPEMVAQAKKKHGSEARYTFEVGNSASLPLESESVDLAASTISFHHWSDQAGGLREVARVLRPGCHFILADVVPPLLMRQFMKNRFHAPRSRQRLFEEAGLRIVASQRPIRLGGWVVVTVGQKK
jgi:ubiquinone/menaquinone biosynthesis C-methylase UbiE